MFAYWSAVVTGSAAVLGHRDLIFGLVARYRLPTIFPARVYIAEGGLACYGPDQIDPYRRAAEYVEAIFLCRRSQGAGLHRVARAARAR
jgi:putative ABC transport system substrate-binding protein